MGVLVGSLMHDGVRLLIAKAIIQYEIQQLREQQQKANEEMRRDIETRKQIEQMKREDEEARRRSESDLCRFWSEQQRNDPTERSKEEVRKNCY